MKLEFRESFSKDLRKISEKAVLRKIDQIIKIVERTSGPSEIPGLKKVSGTGNYFRIRIGDYRIGITIVSGTVTFVRALHRKDVYRYFP
jgi:mRNA interferase RelE/StbE